MEKLTIFYDGACHLCSKEIEHYKKIDSTHKILYLDIAKKSFNFSDYNFDEKILKKYFHVRDQNLKIHMGVDAFYLIWKELDTFKFFQSLYEFNPTQKIMKIFYYLFSQVRPFLPKKKQCSEGVCY